jgi:uncharacterized protein
MMTVRPVLTPCIGVCTLDPAGYCDGCFRTGDEIAGWVAMTDAERLRMMERVLPAREASLSEDASPQVSSPQISST